MTDTTHPKTTSNPPIDPYVEFIRILRNINPALYSIEMINKKLMKDFDHGEIHLVCFVKEGKIIRVEGYPKISRLVET